MPGGCRGSHPARCLRQLLSARTVPPGRGVEGGCCEHLGCLASLWRAGRAAMLCQLPSARQAGVGRAQDAALRCQRWWAAHPHQPLRAGGRGQGPRRWWRVGLAISGGWCQEAMVMAILHLGAGAHGQCRFLGDHYVFRSVTGDCSVPPPALHGIPWDEAPSGLSAASAPWNISSNAGNFYV